MNYLKNKTPCFNCPERKLLCHSFCDKYNAFKKKNEAIDDVRLSKVLLSERWAIK
jgi:hypothetical protein